jgi:TP901 family phage tail tape measure protein
MAVDVGSAIGYLDIDISGFLSGLETALNQTESSKNKIEALGGKISGVGDKLQSVGSSLTKNVTTPLMLVGTAGLKVATDFEKGMSEVKAITQASATDFEALRDTAIDLGASTAFSASEVASAMTEMAKAGWSSQQIIDGMGGVLDAAAASGEGLANVSTIVADAITGFGLAAGDSAMVADLLTQAANSGTIGINDLGESFKYIAPVAQAMGLSITDVTTALSVMSMAGIKGSQAGTSLRTTLTNLVKPTDQIAVAMKELGIEVTNSDGSMKSLDSIVGILRDSFSGLTDEQKSYYAATLAGKEGMSGLLSLLNLTEEEYNAVASSMENANGVAKETAAVMQDNLQSKLEQLMGSLESLAIVMADNVIPPFTSFIEWLTGLVEKFTELSPEAQKFILIAAGIAIAIGPTISIIGKLTSGIGSVVSIIGKATGKFSGFASAASTVAAPAEAAGKGVGSLAKSALNLLAAGAGILMAAGGLALLAQSAIALSEAGWPAVAVMGGLVVALAGLAIGAAAVGPALTAGAVGLVAFGGAIALVGVGILAATSGVALLATQLPTISEYGSQAAGALVELGAGTYTVGAGCAVMDLALISLMIPLAALTLELAASAAACGLLSAAMSSTAASVTIIESSASSASQSLSDMVTSVNVTKAGLNGLGDIANAAAQGIVNAFTKKAPTASSTALTLATGIATSTQAGLEPIPGDVESIMSSMDNAVSSGMASVNSTIRGGFSSAVSYIRSLAGQSYGWGADMMQGLINGINSKVGALRSAVNTVAGIIRANLHFSRPDEGPLRDYETWMPDFMEGLAKGINSNLYQIEGAVGNVTDRLSIEPKSTDDLFSATAVNDLEEYNITLVNTLGLYRQLVEQMRLCSQYSLSMAPMSNGLLRTNPTPPDTPNPVIPSSVGEESGRKPDVLNINVQVGEEQIETVVVDLLRREVRT